MVLWAQSATKDYIRAKRNLICLPFTLHTSYQTTNSLKTTESVLTNLHKTKHTQTSNKFFWMLKKSDLPTTFTLLQRTLLHFTPSVPVICAKFKRHSDCWMETMHGAVNLLLFWGPVSWTQDNFGQQLFFDEGWTIKSHMEPSWDCRGNGPEPGCSSP